MFSSASKQWEGNLLQLAFPSNPFQKKKGYVWSHWILLIAKFLGQNYILHGSPCDLPFIRADTFACYSYAYFIHIQVCIYMYECFMHIHMYMHPIGISLPHLGWQGGQAIPPICQVIPPRSVQKKTLFYHGSHPLEHHAPWGEIHTDPLEFHKSLETWLCQQAWGLNGEVSIWRWSLDWEKTSPPHHGLCAPFSPPPLIIQWQFLV